MKKWRGWLAALVITAGILPGCGDGANVKQTEDAAGSKTTPQASQTTNKQASVWPRTYVDGMNKEVTLDKQPERVAVLHFGYVEYLLALGVEPVAAAQLESVEKFKTLSAYPQMKNIKDVGKVMSPNMEKLIELQPDLIIATLGIHDNAYETLSKIAPVIYKKTYGNWQDTLNDYAKMLGKEEQAEKLSKETEQVIEKTRTKLAGFKDKTFMFLRPSSKGGFGVVGSKQFTYYHDTEKGFGLKTPANYPADYATISLESLAEMNPDYIFFQDDRSLSEKTVEGMASSAVWQAISAVHNGNIAYLDVSLNTSSPFAIKLASEQITESLLK